MRTNTILAAMAIVLAVPTALTVLAEHRSFTDFERVPHLFEGFNTDNVQFIILSKTKKGADATATPATPESEEQDEIVFARSQDRWILGQTTEHPNPLAGVPVQEQRIESDLLERLKEIRLDGKALVAAGVPEGELEKKGLTLETGITISCRNAEKNTVAELVRGHDASGAKTGEDKVHGFYVRPKDRNDVILYEPSTPYWSLTIKPNDWIDLEMHRFQSRDVKSFSLHNVKGDVTFTRGDTQGDFLAWQKEGDQPAGVGAVRVQEVTNLLQRFNTVSCSRFLGPVNDQRYAADVPDSKNNPSEIIVSATLHDGTRYVMRVGKKIGGKQEYFALFEGKRGPSPFLVAVGEWMRSPFEKDPKDLFDPPAPAPGATSPTENPVKQSGEKGAPGGAQTDNGGKSPPAAPSAADPKQEGPPKSSGG